MENKKPKVLLVDDHSDTLELHQSYLESGGMDVYLAMDASEAISQLEVTDIDIVVSDYVMPVSGSHLYAWVRSNRPMLPFLFLTSMPEIKEKGVKKLDKPTEEGSLLEAVRSLLG